MLSHDKEGQTQESAAYPAVPDDPLRAGLYLTNEIFLYRVVGIATSETGRMLEVEDCFSLDIARVPIDEFRARRLRVVTAAPIKD